MATLRMALTIGGLALSAFSSTARAETPGESLIEEIVVTAQRRQQDMQDVPIAVQAFSGERLRLLGASESRDLQYLVPGLVFPRSAANAFPYLRGVGQNQGSQGFESPVSIYVDGVYIPGISGGVFNFNNIDRIEVLKGPQGTLFGRNATGGVINVISRTPSTKPSFDAMVGYGSYQTFESSLYATTGLSKNLALDLSLIYGRQSDGIGRDLTTGAEAYLGSNYGLRTSFLWSGGSTELRGFITKSRIHNDYGTAYEVFPGTLGRDGLTVFPGYYNTYSAAPIDARNLAKGTIAGLTFSHDFGSFKITNILGYAKNSWTQEKNTTGLVGAGCAGCAVLVADIAQSESSITNELQIANSGGKSSLEWIAGFFYLSDDFDRFLRLANFVPGGTLSYGLPQLGHQDVSSYAVYGQATYAILSDTRLTAGLRYTRDHKVYSGRNLPSADTTVRKTWPKVTWRLALDHDIGEDKLIYASYNRGFKSGTFNVTLPPIGVNATPIRPEVLDAYEAGIKSELFSRRLRLNVAGFYYNYKDLHYRAAIGGGVTILRNAATARVKGLEAELQANPTSGLLLTGALSVQKGTYESFPNAPIAVPRAAGGADLVFADLSGKEMMRVPRVSFSVGALYKVGTDYGDFNANIKLFHSSKFNWEADGFLKQPSYTTVDASVGWTRPDGVIGVEFWGKNLTDARYYTQAITAGSFFMLPDLPTTFGVRIRAKYD